MNPWPRIYTIEELEAMPVQYAVYPMDSPSVKFRQWVRRQVDDGVLPGSGEVIQMAGALLAMAGVFGCLGLFVLIVWLTGRVGQGY